MNPTITLIKNAITVTREDYISNRRPMSDDQRRAMFASQGAGGGGGPQRGGWPQNFANPPNHKVKGTPDQINQKYGRQHAAKPKHPPRAHGNKPRKGIPMDERPAADPSHWRQPGDPSGGFGVLPMPPSYGQRPPGGSDQIWPGGSPPWVFDPRTGGPNPDFPHPDNPNFGGPSIQPVPANPGGSDRIGVLGGPGYQPGDRWDHSGGGWVAPDGTPRRNAVEANPGQQYIAPAPIPGINNPHRGLGAGPASHLSTSERLAAQASAKARQRANAANQDWRQQVTAAMRSAAQPGPDTFMGPGPGRASFTRAGFHPAQGGFIPFPGR